MFGNWTFLSFMDINLTDRSWEHGFGVGVAGRFGVGVAGRFRWG